MTPDDVARAEHMIAPICAGCGHEIDKTERGQWFHVAEAEQGDCIADHQRGAGVKAMTLRLPRDQADDLELVATVNGQPISDEVRGAIVAHIERRRKDPEFQARLRRVIDANRAALERLAKS